MKNKPCQKLSACTAARTDFVIWYVRHVTNHRLTCIFVVTDRDTASNLGNAMDELMRHQPTLRTDAMKAIIELLNQIKVLGHDPNTVCTK